MSSEREKLVYNLIEKLSKKGIPMDTQVIKFNKVVHEDVKQFLLNLDKLEKDSEIVSMTFKKSTAPKEPEQEDVKKIIYFPVDSSGYVDYMDIANGVYDSLLPKSKLEEFNLTLCEGWEYKPFYLSSAPTAPKEPEQVDVCEWEWVGECWSTSCEKTTLSKESSQLHGCLFCLKQIKLVERKE